MIRIKLAILESDAVYLNRIVSVFSVKYTDKMEIHSFTNVESAISLLETQKIDVLLCDEEFDIDMECVPERCGFAYFVDNPGIDEINGYKAISKFQKAELIYKQILDIYSEKAVAFSGKKLSGNGTKILMFTSFSGGVGTSTLAAATSRYLAAKNKKVMYLNLENNGNSEIFFKGEGQATFGDVIYALKSKKANLAIKIESAVKISDEGVRYFAAPKVALDFMELNNDEIFELIQTIVTLGEYEYVVIDIKFDFNDLLEELWAQVDDVILVSDGGEIANSKLERSCNAIEAMQEYERKYELNKAKLVYNKFSNKTSKTVIGINLLECGGVPKYEHATTSQIVEQISSMNFLEKVVS